MKQQRAIIIGAGPAGLTAAYELLTRTAIRPIVLERSDYMGGLSRTVNYKGNLIDIGGHRFFSKSDRVLQWWQNFMPIEADGPLTITYHRQTQEVVSSQNGHKPRSNDLVMLVRKRRSRIYFLRRFFDYPLQFNLNTLANLGVGRTFLIVLSYLRSCALPIRNERTLEQFLINRFGKVLYRLFFKSYTEKVWGVACSQISAEWGVQRIKGLSIWRTIRHFVRSKLKRKPPSHVETSLIEQFLYPKHGPGQLWEEVARRVTELGGEILTNWEVSAIETNGSGIKCVRAVNVKSGEERRFEGDVFFSTMAVKDLVRSLLPEPPSRMQHVAEGLVYRDFITVGVLCRELNPNHNGARIKDNWIYIQEPDVSIGRLQIFNNWSPHMAKDSSTVWLGLEYFCTKGDPLWRKSDDEMIRLGIEELERIGIITSKAVLDATVLRMEKAYPAYFGTYQDFPELRMYLDRFDNLYLIGRNGMHRYNNQDHSMLTAMVAVDNIAANDPGKSNIWDVNTEDEYQELKK